jgi:hypothetical protein
MRILKPVPTTHHTNRKVFVHPALRDSKFVFIRHDATRTPLQPIYDGPYQVLSRTNKHLELATPTGKQMVSTDRVKPAFLLTDTSDHITSPAPVSSASQTVGTEPKCDHPTASKAATTLDTDMSRSDQTQLPDQISPGWCAYIDDRSCPAAWCVE